MREKTGAAIERPKERLVPLASDLFWWKGDSCNVYILRDGNAAALIDIGSGDVLQALESIGVEQVEHVFLTQHHREQSTGLARLDPGVTLVVSPGEHGFVRHPEHYVIEEIAPTPFTVGGASYLRPLRRPSGVRVQIARDADLLTWRSHTLEAYETPGASPGGMTYVWTQNDERIAFSGNVCLEGGTLYRLFDSEWDYGYANGFETLLASQRLLSGLALTRLCPGHGAVITNPGPTLAHGSQRLHGLIQSMLRDYSQMDNSVANVSRPTSIPGVRRISPHLFSLRTAKRHNAYILLSDDGHALFIDCGLFIKAGEDTAFLDAKIDAMKRAYGLRTVDAVIITHYHGDHVRQIPHLAQRYGAQVWAHVDFAAVLENPWAFNLTWMLPAYRGKHAAFRVDRVLHNDECVEWRGYTLEVFHAPGQTEYAQGLFAQIDGTQVAFTGDNLFYSAEGSGHDAYSMFNSGGVMERGYLASAETLLERRPELILGGHGQEIPAPMRQLKALHSWATDFRERLVDLVWDEAYEMGVDPFWARFQPYRTWMRSRERAALQLHVQNYYPERLRIDARLKAPTEWRITPRETYVQAGPGERVTLPFEVCAGDTFEQPVVVTADLTLGTRRMGEFPQALIFPGEPPAHS